MNISLTKIPSWKKISLLLLILTVILSLIYSKTEEKNNEEIKIGVSQLISHPALDSMLAGVKSEIDKSASAHHKKVIYDIQNAQGDMNILSSIVQKFSTDPSYALFVTLETPSSQALLNKITDRPIVFVAITDPVKSGLVSSLENPGGNATGTQDAALLYMDQLQLIKDLNIGSKVGIVYNPSESNAVASLSISEDLAVKLGLSIQTAPANNTGEVISAARSLSNDTDVFYMLPDNTITAAQESLIKVSLESKKPLIAFEQSSVEKGALATIGNDYFFSGEEAGAIASKILFEEKKPKEIPVSKPTKGNLFINEKTAEEIGVSLPQNLLDSAYKIYR